MATTDYGAVLDTDLTFLGLPSPSREDGNHGVVTKSTVIPTTTAETFAPILADASGKQLGDDLQIAMKPEFLREGTAVEDFRNPDKIVFGTDSETALDGLHDVFEPLIECSDTAVIETGVDEA